MWPRRLSAVGTVGAGAHGRIALIGRAENSRGVEGSSCLSPGDKRLRIMASVLGKVVREGRVRKTYSARNK